MIQKILIANRGEIVKRILRTCKQMGIQTVAVYSDADRDAAYLKEADEAVYIGKSAPIKSYLNIEALIGAVKQTGADAVHPGYGFLSESAEFAQAVEQAGAKWIGPTPQILCDIESKCYCRICADNLGVPVTPGSLHSVTSAAEILDIARQVGYPVLLKLDKGGGGKGIQKLEADVSESAVQTMLESLQRIGQMAFASDEVYVEKAVQNPRHIEVQFFADDFGAVLCLGERECSIQRRYQKIIEESPSSAVSDADRALLYDYTRKVATAMAYRGAGTIEFLRDGSGKFYFMEINARLQVEHPVSEYVTGRDFVRLQIDIANGKPLDFRQEDVQLRGHAIECRVYAEDPRTFQPAPGVIRQLTLPDPDDPAIRVDHAIGVGFKVSPFYDPMLAKVITWGENRRACIENMKRALSQFHIEGIPTTRKVSLAIMRDKGFVTGQFDTGFLETEKLNIGLDNYVVTISRQFGSLGRPIAIQMAKLLGVDYYDRDVLEKVLEKAQLPLSDPQISDELTSTDSYRKMKYPLGQSSPEEQDRLFEIQKGVIEELAGKESCIFVGRCSDYILRNHANHFSIFIYAPYEVRRKNCIDILKIDENEVDDLIQSVDEARHTYTMHYAKTFSEDVSSKDILIDSSLYGNVEEAAAVLVDMVKKKFNLA